MYNLQQAEDQAVEVVMNDLVQERRDANATVEVIKMPYYESGTKQARMLDNKEGFITAEEQDAALSQDEDS